MLGFKLNHVSKGGAGYWLSSKEMRYFCMMTSSNGNIFRVTGPLCGEFTGPGEFPAQRPVTRSFDVFFDLRPDKRLSKQPWGWWFETPSWSLWRQCNVLIGIAANCWATVKGGGYRNYFRLSPVRDTSALANVSVDQLNHIIVWEVSSQLR